MARYNGKLMVPLSIIEPLIDANFSLNERRIILGLLLAQDLNDAWLLPDVDLDLSPPQIAQAAWVRTFALPDGTNDNRALIDAIDTVSKYGWFELLGVSRNGRLLNWRFTDDIIAIMSTRNTDARTPYALIDMELFRGLRSQTQQQLYLHFQSIVRMNYPIFEVDTPPQAWKRTRDKVLRTLRLLADRYGVTFHVASCYDPTRLELAKLSIKIETSETKWTSKALKMFTPNAGVTIIRPQKAAIEKAEQVATPDRHASHPP